ncbi:VG15 protein [Streptomyces rochei]|uniref:MuF-like minor capsid protein n=1 Tax=Streptomyces rochei TaxID=1928 RepID=A0ABW7E4G1_STRRO
MATTVSDGSDAANRYRAAQIGLTRLLVRDVRGLRRLILPSRLRESVPDWLAAMNAVVAQYARTSTALAAEFYDAQREAAGVPGPFTVPVADPPPEEQTTASLRWATKDLWPREPEEATPAQLEPMDVRLAQAQKKAEQVAQKLVADTGRGTVREAVRQDRQAVAWARVAALGACYFCKVLATRGAVYEQDTADFRAHDGCHCGVVPVFRGQRFELSPHAREWERIYREYAQGHSGDQLRLFRRALAEHDSNPLPAAH